MASWRHDHYAREDDQPGEQIDALFEALRIVAVFLVVLGLLAWGPTLMKAIGL